ncbi:putative CRM domain-containing protein [Helianthus anomalus]
MVMRAGTSLVFGKSKHLKKNLPFIFLHSPSFSDKVWDHEASSVISHGSRYLPGGTLWCHSTTPPPPPMAMAHKVPEPTTSCEANTPSEAKPKRKKLKGKRAVVRWLKFFRYKKKKDYSRMTAEEKILFKLRKAQRKEKQLVEALNKIEPKESSETIHDPEILTPEEHFYFLKMGKKSKNYVPIGRRGIYQGVILNMHLHWKKHETLQVIIKTFTPDEVKEMAAELARLSGGIVLDIYNDDTIIMYRGKNYSQPPTEIMSPRVTLPRKKALDKSKYKDALRAVRRYIPRLEQDLELVRAKAENEPGVFLETQISDTEVVELEPEEFSRIQLEAKEKLEKVTAKSDKFQGDDDEDDSVTGSELISDSEDLSDIFETDCETDEENDEKPLYLNEFDKFPVESNEAEDDDFKEHLRRISANSKKEGLDFDDVDRVVLRAASLLKKRR